MNLDLGTFIGGNGRVVMASVAILNITDLAHVRLFQNVVAAIAFYLLLFGQGL